MRRASGEDVAPHSSLAGDLLQLVIVDEASGSIGKEHTCYAAMGNIVTVNIEAGDPCDPHAIAI
ncbi:hypothetical protein H7Q97_08190 [Ochrobactrum sp. CM-21-5]|nr:hypothetical protein [Ochrobactrum sp. CM-21-5]MBC2885385.1 hypothetical protein [Ochrobactrum sp. CM-21-5]